MKRTVAGMIVSLMIFITTGMNASKTYTRFCWNGTPLWIIVIYTCTGQASEKQSLIITKMTPYIGSTIGGRKIMMLLK
jgi:hypothetical protein